MPRTIRILFTIATALLVASAIAQPKASPKSTPDDSPVPFAESPQGMNQQQFKDFEKADAELNRVYQKLVSALSDDSSRAAKLKTAQQAWIKFRDAQADFDASEMEGGSAEPLLRYGSMTASTRQRTKDLRETLKTMEPPATPAAKPAKK